MKRINGNMMNKYRSKIQLLKKMVSMNEQPASDNRY